jgi:hypothetical protein
MLQNDGHGVFAAFAGNLPAAESIQFGDLDEDGDLDALAIVPSSGLEAWWNDGQGNFTRSEQGILSESVDHTQVGDLDGDGDLDIFVSAYSQDAAVLLNDGQGHFTPLRQFGLGGFRQDSALSDLNGDGLLDLLLLENRYANVRLNHGNGWFSGGTNFDTTNALSLDLGDIDGDGDVDAVFTGENRTTVWLNDGVGSFSKQQTLSIAALGNDVSLGDLDADGDLDLLIATGAGASDQIWHNDGFGFFIRAQQSLGSGSGLAIALADFDGDGDLDAYVGQEGADVLWLNHPALGDTFPFDGVVQLSDLNSVRNYFGSTGAADGTLPGDTFPFNGVVGLEDLNAVRNHFGGSIPLPVATSPSESPRTKPSLLPSSLRTMQDSGSAFVRNAAADLIFAQFAATSENVPEKKPLRGSRTMR